MRLELIFLVLLALVWAVVLIPSLIRGRLESSPIDGVRSFERSMGVLANTRSRRQQQTSGRWILIPRNVTPSMRRRARVLQRRRRAFERLLVVAVLTFILGIVPALRWMWFVHLAADLALGFYVARLRKWKRDERARHRGEGEAVLVEEPRRVAGQLG